MFDVSNLRFNADGLIPAIAQDHATGEVLMMAWMSRESIQKTLQDSIVTYWSRSRNELWEKGATSGHVQRLIEMRIDCDRDALLILVDQTGPACHTNRQSCFYTAVRDGKEVVIADPVKG